MNNLENNTLSDNQIHQHHDCYKLPQNPVFKLRKNYINQDETRVLSPLPTTYILCDLHSTLRHPLMSFSHYYITTSCIPLPTMSLLHHKNEDEPLHYPSPKIASSQYQRMFFQAIEW